MSPDDLLDYSLGLIDPARHESVERRVAADPELLRQTNLITVRLGLLLDDGEGPEPPIGLARRTINLVEKRRGWRGVLDIAPARSQFRLADLAVAACVVVVAGLTMIPAVHRSHQSALTTACANNLRQLGIGLIRYATAHNVYPHPGPKCPAPFAGTFALQLHDQGLIEDATLLDCPVNGPNDLPRSLPSFGQLISLGRESHRAPCLSRSDYAYNIGRSGQGQPRPLPATLSGDVPLLADAPLFDAQGRALKGNSANHGGAGQSVFFSGGHVQFLRTPRHGVDPDIFHNRDDRTAPGLNDTDHVLAPGIATYPGH